MNLIDANLINLTNLWKRYGAIQIADNGQVQVYRNTYWPHRCWLEGDSVANNDMTSFIDHIPDSATVSLWSTKGANPCIEQQLRQRGWRCTFKLTAMCFNLNGLSSISPSDASFRMQPVNTLADVKEWVEIGSDAFGYNIDVPVIEKLINESDFRLLLGTFNGEAVASALLYKTGDTVGVHQLGVKCSFQGRGIARQFMQRLLIAGTKWQGKAVVLQASEVGLPLYESLRFTRQFIIDNYQKML